MPIKGVDTLRRNMRQTFRDIREKKAVQFVNAVLSIGETESKEFTPVAYSNLVNSIIKEVVVGTSMVKGALSYNTKYAAYLENNKKWKPRPPPKYANKKKGIGPAPAWNPKATPGYLRKGFESKQSQASIIRAIDIFKV